MNTKRQERTNKYLIFKKTVSAGLACALLLNTACGVQARDKSRFSLTTSMENYLNEEGNSTRGDVNPVEPILIEDSMDENGDRHLTFDIPKDEDTSADLEPSRLPRVYSELSQAGALVEQQREYLRGYSQRLNEAREACKTINCAGIPSLDPTSPHSIRVGRDGIDSNADRPLKTEEDVLRELERIEQELLTERERWKKISNSAKEQQADVERAQQNLLAEVAHSVDDAIQTAHDENRLSESLRRELVENHNQQTKKLYSELGLDPHHALPISTPNNHSPLHATPYQLEVNRLKQANTVLRATSFDTRLNDSAEVMAELAERSAQRGQLESFDERLATARAFAAASQHKGKNDGEALKTALEMTAGAKSLDAQGLPRLADTAAKMAKALLHVALDISRLTAVVDLPLSVMEAFSGKTIDFDSDGQTFLRDCSSLERGFALGTLVLTTGGVLMGAAPVALAAAAAGKVLRAFKEQAATVRGAETGAKVFEETVTVAREIDRVAPALMSKTTLSPYAKKHIWYGEVRVSADNLKVRIDGGLHTHDGLQKYLARAPLENQPVSRELLPNGVERVVFPDSALTNREAIKLSTAAKHGFGVPNGKTLFPSGWTPEKVEAAIQSASLNGQIVGTSKKGFRKVIKHDGVTVVVNYGVDGRVNSAFPRWEQ